MDYWINGLLDQWIIGLLDYWGIPLPHGRGSAARGSASHPVNPVKPVLKDHGFGLRSPNREWG